MSAIHLGPETRAAFAKPRRPIVLPTPEEVELVSAGFRHPGSTYTLKPEQVLALVEAQENNGLFGILPVGTGKTLIARCAARALGVERWVFMHPAGARDSLRAAFEALEKELVCGPAPIWLSYHELSNDPEALESTGPALIVADEVQNLKTLGAGCTKRWLRYMHAHPETLFVALTGTVARAGLLDYAHLLLWALKDGAPVPLGYQALQDLAAAIDIAPKEPKHPRHLVETYGDEHQIRRMGLSWDHARQAAREVWRSRLVQTPGVVTAAGSSTDQPLAVRRRHTTPPLAIAAALQDLRDLWRTPDGTYLSSPLEVRQAAFQLGTGFHYTWEVPPPVWYRSAAKAWSEAAQYVVKILHRDIDTEGEVKKAIRRGDKFPAWVPAALQEWEEAQAALDYKLVRHGVWVDTWALEAAAEWLHAAPRRLAWVGYVELGQRLAELTGLPYYHALAVDQRTRRALKDHPEPVPAILSYQACQSSHNLQWANESLFLACLPCDQSLGRTHRQGQTRPVSAEVWTPHEWARAGLDKAQAIARALYESTWTPSAFAHLVLG